MANAFLSVCILSACLAPQCAIGESDVTQCLSDDAGIAETSLLQKKQARQKLIPGLRPLNMLSSFTSDHKLPSEGDDAGVGAYGLATLPAKLVDRMVISNPYKCKFLPGPGDFRAAFCDKTMLEAGLYPGDAPNNTAVGLVRLDSLRTLLPIGSLPCCSTAPFCAAPDCALHRTRTSEYLLPGTYYQEPRPQAADNITCTKRNAASNFAYMTHPDVWLAYRLAGGSLDLDVQKHWDILGTLHTMTGPMTSWHLHAPWVVHPAAPPFDLVIDLGANFGLVTEKLVMRRFAKDYILVEAVPELRQIFDGRFGNSTWRDQFVAEQTATWQGADPFTPSFEFMNFALSDRAGGFLDTCSFNWRNRTPTTKCSSEMASVDSIIPGRLSAKFVDRFAKAQSAYVKVDVEGMDQMVVNGMKQLLSEKRGENYLVNFMMLEFCAPCMEAVRMQNFNSDESYDLKTFTETLHSQGFEAFLIGPRYIPLTHGSWDDAFVDFSKDPENQGCDVTRYPKFKELLPEMFPNGECEEFNSKKTTFTADIFALRSGHPRAEEIKVLLGACEESHDFNPNDPQYDLSSTM